jgi:hypothetical protein
MMWAIGTESDEILRERLRYVSIYAHEEPILERELHTAHGEKLDEIAARYSLKRRRL